MNVQSKRENKAREYRDMAQTSIDLAEGAGLEHVREKHARAANVWTELALLEESRITQSRAVQEAASARLDAMSDDQKLTAIEQGCIGSYNLSAPNTTDAFAGLNFQHVAAQALGIAHGRGYVVREVRKGELIDGLLVTIPAAASNVPSSDIAEGAAA